MAGTHSHWGPSALHRLMRCPGSAKGVSDNKTSVYAAEGTLLHEIASDCLEFGLDPDDFVGQTMEADGHTFTVDEDMASCMVAALDWLREQPGKLHVETRVNLSMWLPETYGTADVAIYDEATKHLTVFDWKFGAGRPVHAENNEQIQAYALGVWATILKPWGHTPDTVSLIIEQPRCANAGRFYEPWVIEFEDLLRFGNLMTSAYEAAKQPDAPRVPGEKQCQWCPLKNSCSAYDSWMFEMLGNPFENLEGTLQLPASCALTPERRCEIVRNKSLIESWLGVLHQQTLDDALNGRPTPGLKAVQGKRGDRKWINEESPNLLLTAAIGEDRFVKKLISPAQAEKLLAPGKKKKGDPKTWDALNRLVVQSEGSPILVSEKDKRPPVKADAAAIFEDLSGVSHE